MKPMNDRTPLGRLPTAGQPAQRKRFRIEKLEERIAPSYGCKYNPNTKWIGGRYTVCCQ